MRLIDAEALREKILAMPTDGDTVQPFIDKFGVVGTIDAAPTIACETCGTVDGWNREAAREWCNMCRCGILYEPKEQK